MLRINKSGDTAKLLHLCYNMKCYRGLTTSLRTVDLHNSSLRNTSYSKCKIQPQRTCRECLHVHMGIVTELHHRALAVCLLDLCNSRLQCLSFILIDLNFLCHNLPHFLTNKCSYSLSINYFRTAVNSKYFRWSNLIIILCPLQLFLQFPYIFHKIFSYAS
jgi:hypothetical protein